MQCRLLPVLMSRKVTEARSLIHTSSKCLIRGHVHQLPQTGWAYPSGSTSKTFQEPRPDALYRLLEVEVRGNENAVLTSYVKFVTMACKELEINLAEVAEPWRFIKKRTLLRSAFVHKKHREQYEWRTYFRIFRFKHLTGSTADTLLEYIQRNLPEGVAMQVRRHQLEPLPDHIRPPSTASS